MSPIEALHIEPWQRTCSKFPFVRIIGKLLQKITSWTIKTTFLETCLKQITKTLVNSSNGISYKIITYCRLYFAFKLKYTLLDIAPCWFVPITVHTIIEYAKPRFVQYIFFLLLVLLTARTYCKGKDYPTIWSTR